MAALSSALQRLQSLVDGRAFESVASTLSSFDPHLEAAAHLVDLSRSAAEAGGSGGNGLRAGFQRSLTRLAQSLAALNAPLQAAIAAGSHASVAQLKAAYCVLTSGATLFRLLELGPAVGAQLGSAACIVFGSGRCLLDAARSTPAVRGVLQGGLGSAGAALEAVTQMQAVAELEATLRPQAAVYAQAFAPEPVLPWLTALTEFFLSLGDSPAGSVDANTCHAYCNTVLLFTRESLGSPILAPMQPEVSVQQRIVALLLRCLRTAAHGPTAAPHDSTSPAEQASNSVEFANQAAMALCRQTLQAGLQRHFSASREDAAYALHAATQLLAQSMLLAGGRMGRAAARLRVAPAGPLVAAAAQPGQPQPAAHRVTCLVLDALQLYERLLAGLPTSSRAGYMAALGVLPLVAAAAQELVPPAAHSILTSPADAGPSQAVLIRLQSAIAPQALAVPVLRWAASGLHIASADELMQCCTAAEAAISILAVTMQLASECQQAEAQEANAPAGAELAATRLELLQGAQLTSQSCMGLWATAIACMTEICEQPSLRRRAQSSSTQQAQLQLHSQACRLVHWVCSGPGSPLERAPSWGEQATWTALLEFLASTWLATKDSASEQHTHATEEGPDVHSARLKQAARCAALLEAASVLLQWGAEFEGLTPWSQLALVEAAAAVGATVVGLPVWRSATAVLRTACQEFPAGGVEPYKMLRAALRTLHWGLSVPVNAELATSGVLGELLAAARTAVSRVDAAKAQAIATAALGSVALLAEAAHYIPAALRGLSPADSDGIAHLLRLANEARCPVVPPAQQLAQLQAVLPPALRLAANITAFLRQPEQQAEQQLGLAQAAATRSCAYLRCANVGAEGGPDAGQGLGSMRCSACRAVWYCGTACSHADWREGGHRRVCKALGAERQRQKQEWAAARAEGQQQAGE